MKKYIVYLRYYDFDTSEVIEAQSKSKAKGVYIKKHLKSFNNAGYPKSSFFCTLAVSKI